MTKKAPKITSKKDRKVSINDFLLLSEKFHELAEDMEDQYRILKNKNNMKRNEYVNADVLDKFFVKINAQHISK